MAEFWTLSSNVHPIANNREHQPVAARLRCAPECRIGVLHRSTDGVEQQARIAIGSEDERHPTERARNHHITLVPARGARVVREA